MSKILVFAVALAVVLGSGAFFNAQADCGFQWPSVCGCHSSAHDKDLAAVDRGPQGNNDWERDLNSTPYNSYR